MLALSRLRLPPCSLSGCLTLLRRPPVGRRSIIESLLFCVAREPSGQSVMQLWIVGVSKSPAGAQKSERAHRIPSVELFFLGASPCSPEISLFRVVFREL